MEIKIVIKQVLNDYEQQDEMKVRIYEKDKYVEINRNVILCMILSSYW